ncbi:MAG TPA: hypothetical protein PK977_14490 [Chitinophagaceae bacterium]|nr:hypothetical protein [Chitinophagaceae bacterium]
MLKKSIFAFSILVSLQATTQTYDQWAQTVGWDGISHWKKYMYTQPAYMGPNALPVPRLGNSSIDSSFFIAVTGMLHFSKGDNTQNLSVYANYCLVKDLISFDAVWVPYERYNMSLATKQERHVFAQFFYDKEATGEVHLNTNLQLLNKWRKHIHLVLRLGYRFPCSSGFGAARYSDGPGYYFDLSFGKTLGKNLKWNGMTGFYSWQIQSDKHQQDDAFLFGTGLEWNQNNWRIQTNVAGYLGYLKNSGDKPVVYRFNLEKRIKRTGVLLAFQQGLHDFDYSTIEFGAKYYLNRKSLSLAKLPK